MVCAPAPHGDPYAASPYRHGKKTDRTSEDAMTTQEQDVPSVPDIDLSHAVRSDACVLFTGDQETAEVLARRLHRLSGWRQGPFVAGRLQPAGGCRWNPARSTSCDVESPETEDESLADAWRSRGPCSCATSDGYRAAPTAAVRAARHPSNRVPGNPGGSRRRVISSTPTPLSSASRTELSTPTSITG